MVNVRPTLGDTLGQKRYELSNHLGNVLAVISDKRIVKGCGQYEAELHQATDYYPFGSPMPGRSITLGNNPAVSKHRLAPAFFKQQKYYAIDGKKTLYLYYPHIPAGGGAPFDYVLRCTTTTPPGLVTYTLSSTGDLAGVQAFAALINATPLKATAVIGQQEIVPGALFDVIAITFGPELASVPYKDISFSGSTGGDPFHLFVNPGNNTDDDYRYGFNGKENDGETNTLDFDNRCYDPRVGRWMSEDPKKEKYPEMSPFTGFGNNPLYYVDPGGETLRVHNTNGKGFVDYTPGMMYEGKDLNVAYVISSFNYLLRSPTANKIICDLACNRNVVNFEFDPKKNSIHQKMNTTKDYNGKIVVNSKINLNFEKIEYIPTLSSAGYSDGPEYMTIFHETAHAYDLQYGMTNRTIGAEMYDKWKVYEDPENDPNMSELWGTHIENVVRWELYLPIRSHYGITVDGKIPLYGTESTRIVDEYKQSLFFKQSPDRLAPSKLKEGDLPFIYSRGR